MSVELSAPPPPVTEPVVAALPAPARRRRLTAARARSLALVGGTVAASLATPALGRGLRRWLPGPAADKAAAVGLAAAGTLVVAAVESRHPHRREWRPPAAEVRREAVRLAVTVPAASLTSLVVADGVGRRLRRALDDRGVPAPWPARAPLAARVLLTLAAADLVHYGYHRLGHRTAVGWRIHGTHHTPTRLYGLNGKRVSVGEGLVLGATRTLPLVALGADPGALAAYEVFMAIFGQLQHANIDLDDSPANLVLSTADQHRWHHSVDRAESEHNYAAVFSLWDRLFGSYHLPRRPFHGDVGPWSEPGPDGIDPAARGTMAA